MRRRGMPFPHLQKMAQGVPRLQIFCGRSGTVAATPLRRNLRWSYTGWSIKTDTLCFVRLNFIKYWPIFELISLSESGEHF